ncbi:MAG: tetratricopeptide repeat protein [Nitrospinaceae bacterium]
MKALWTALGLAAGLLMTGLPQAAAEKTEIVPPQILEGYRLVEDWRTEEADALSLSLLEKYPKLGDAHFLRAKVEFFKGNYEHAWKILKHVDNQHRPIREFKVLVNETQKAASHFISRESEHFIFRFVQGADEILIPYAKKVLERSYQVLGELFDYHPRGKVLVEIYPNREPLSQVSPLTRKDILISGTVALCKYNRIMLISPASLVRGYNWMDTLSHEYIHYLLTKKSHNNLPLWMHEGIAKHFESRWREGGAFLSPLMETVLASGLANDYLVSLESMMPSLAKLKTQEDVQLAYAEVATMMDFLIQEKGERVFSLFLKDLAEGQPFESVFPNRAGMDLPVFQERWKQFMSQKNLNSIPGLRPLQTRFKTDRSDTGDEKDYREVGTGRTQDLTFLGDILKSRNQLKAAILEYEKALRENRTESPILYNKLAGVHLIIKEYDKAEILLKKSLRHYPDFHTTLANLGELYFQMEKFQQAREYFDRAARINPFNPVVHLRLIKIYEKLHLPKDKKLQAKLYSHIENQ